MIKDRIQKKIIPHVDLSAFKILEEDVDGVFLNWNDLSKIYHLDMSIKPGLTKYRDLFIVGWLTGFRFSDYSTLSAHHYKDGMLHVKQRKTGFTAVVPLRADAKRILIEKYQLKMPKVSMVNFSYYIKEVIRLAGLNETVKISYSEETKFRKRYDLNMHGYHDISRGVPSVQMNTWRGRHQISLCQSAATNQKSLSEST